MKNGRPQWRSEMCAIVKLSPGVIRSSLESVEYLHAHGVAKRQERSPPALLSCLRVPKMPVFQAYRGRAQPRFASAAERECAKILDYHGVPWDYEPRTFVLEEAPDGRIVEAFTPDFYLPEQDLYLEVTVMRQALVTRKNRKLRKLRERYPEVNAKLFYRRDIERLAQRYRLDIAR